MDDKNKERSAKFTKAARDIQKQAARMDAILSKSEQEENNRLLALRIEERKAARQDITTADIIKNGTPEEKAILHLKNFDSKKYGKSVLSEKEQKYLINSFESIEEKAIFVNYLKLYADLGQYADKLLYVVKMYEVEAALLSKLIDKYEAIQRDITMYEILYGSLVMSKGNSGMGYNLQDNDKKNMKRLDDTTPEALLAEMNEVHKKDGVIFRSNIHGELKQEMRPIAKNVTFRKWVCKDDEETLIADIDFKGGLYDQIKEQAEDCKKKLSFVKAYIEPVEAYLDENDYYAFSPSRLLKAITDIKEQNFTRDIIAHEYHRSYVNDKRSNGEEVTKGEEYEAVVPDYREITAHKEVKDSCIKYLKETRDEP